MAVNGMYLVSGDDTADVQAAAFASGTAVYFTRRAPGKTSRNEDALALIPAGPGTGILVVADGVGGYPDGDVASHTVVAALDEAVARCRDNGATLRDCVLDAVESANRRILASQSGCASTMAAVEIEDYRVRPYHVGDSAIVISGQRGRLKWKSVAHSPTGYAVESGLLEEHLALEHSERHLVSNIVGTSDMRIDIGPPMRLAPRDTLLLSSDGLTDNLRLEEIVEIVRKGPLVTAARALVEQCTRRMLGEESGGLAGHPDDLSVLLYRPG